MKCRSLKEKKKVLNFWHDFEISILIRCRKLQHGQVIIIFFDSKVFLKHFENDSNTTFKSTRNKIIICSIYIKEIKK